MESKHEFCENRLSDSCTILTDIQCRYLHNAVELRILWKLVQGRPYIFMGINGITFTHASCSFVRFWKFWWSLVMHGISHLHSVFVYLLVFLLILVGVLQVENWCYASPTEACYVLHYYTIHIAFTGHLPVQMNLPCCLKQWAVNRYLLVTWSEN